MQQVIRSRRIVLFAVYVIHLIGGWVLAGRLIDTVGTELLPSNEAVVHRTLMATTAIFAVASAVPFVPGAEIGFGLMLVFGKKVAMLVYVAMVSALLGSFLMGRVVPPRQCASACTFFGLERAHDLMRRLEELSREQWLDFLVATAPKRIVPFLMRHRYLALVLLFNLPGNSLLGGGGGIAFSAGLSRLFSFPGYLAAVLVAVAPVPLFFMFVR